MLLVGEFAVWNGTQSQGQSVVMCSEVHEGCDCCGEKRQAFLCLLSFMEAWVRVLLAPSSMLMNQQYTGNKASLFLYPMGESFFFFFSCFKVLLKYSWFTMLWQFLPYNKVTRLYTYTHPFFFGFFAHRIWGGVPWVIQQVLFGYRRYPWVERVDQLTYWAVNEKCFPWLAGA